MKLSEAIRLGAMLGPQVFGRTFSDDGGSCALGAGLRAVGVSGCYTDAYDVFPIANLHVADPISGRDMLLLSVVRVLNDQERWTRERIADWVATIERQHEPHATHEDRLVAACEV